jgi:CheY-like chemotaxis protein
MTQVQKDKVKQILEGMYLLRRGLRETEQDLFDELGPDGFGRTICSVAVRAYAMKQDLEHTFSYLETAKKMNDFLQKN